MSIYVQNAKACAILNNTIVSDETSTSDTATRMVGGAAGELTTSGTHRIERNVSEVLSYGGTPTLSSNITMGANPTMSIYFDGPTFVPTTRAEALTQLSYKIGGPLDIAGSYEVGAVGSSAVNFASSNPSATAG